MNDIFTEFCAYLYKRRVFLAANFIIVSVVAIIFAFVVAGKEYSATVTFLPPAANEMGGMSAAMAAMGRGTATLPISMGGSGITPEQIEVVFESNATKRRIIDEFDLVKYFKLEDNPNQFLNAVKAMKNYVELKANISGSMMMSRIASSYDITTFHRSPDTAKIMADFVFAVMDSTIREISVDRAQRNRVFVENQIEIQNERMDSLQAVFQEFQNTHKAYDIPEQARLSLSVYAELKAASLMNELRLSTLRNEFSGSNHEITELRRNQRVLDSKLREFESGDDANVIPSLDRSSRLFPEFAKMQRDIEVQNQVILFLTRELEQARLQEARDISPLIIVDPAFVPEYKARPKRARLLIAITGGYMFFLTIIVILYKVFSDFKRSGGFSNLLKSSK